jgi:hypothetical protein
LKFYTFVKTLAALTGPNNILDYMKGTSPTGDFCGNKKPNRFIDLITNYLFTGVGINANH